MKYSNDRYNIRGVVEGRLNLQTNQRKLQKEFGINYEDFDIEDPYFLSQYAEWDKEKRWSFINLISGEYYFKKTKAFIDSRLKLINTVTR